MNIDHHFTKGVRVANFSDIHLNVPNLLVLESEETAVMVKKIRAHADLPYVFVVAGEKAAPVRQLLSALSAMRSPCYPYALFLVGGLTMDDAAADVDIVSVDDGQAAVIEKKIDEYAKARLSFDRSRLQATNTGSVPENVDVVIVGGGITGLYAAHRLSESGRSFCILEKETLLGGIWTRYANATSRVNSSECAYRLVDKKTRSNRDHSATREILEDMARLAGGFSHRIFLQTRVEKIEKGDDGYRVAFIRDGQAASVSGKGVILAINDRIGPPRMATWADQDRFSGKIVAGMSDEAAAVDWRDKKVVIVGMGAFAIENARTALEGGARHVTVVCRRHGTVCPKIIDYLNFATPYDEAFKHDKKSNFKNMMYWKKMYETSGATQPECWMGKVKHEGHTISVSDIWFVGHYLKMIQTKAGEITGMFEDGVVVDGQDRVEADIVVNCIGFESNASVAKTLCGYETTTNINYVDKDFMYLADAYIDDDAFNSFFGSSVLEMTKFYMNVYLRYFDDPGQADLMAADGVYRILMEDRRWSHYIAGAAALIDHDPDLYQLARQQVDDRTANFLEKHDLTAYIRENRREWIDLHTMLAGKPMAEADCMPYVFDKLLPKTT